MEGNPAFGGAVEALEGVDGGLVVLMRWRVIIRGKEGVDRCNVGVCACCEPVDGANDTLVHLRASLEVGFVFIGGRDGVNEEAGALRAGLCTQKLPINFITENRPKLSGRVRK